MVWIPPEYIAALRAFAFQDGFSFAEYERGTVHDHILERGAALRERGAAFRDSVNAGKAYVIGYNRRLTTIMDVETISQLGCATAV